MSETAPPFEKISPASEEYFALLDRDQMSIDTCLVFGGEYYATVNDPDSTAEYQLNRLEAARGFLVRRLESRDVPDHQGLSLTVCRDLEQFGGIDATVVRRYDGRRVAEFIAELPAEQFGQFLFNRAQHVVETQPETNRRFTEMFRGFIEKVQQGIAEGWLPLTIEQLSRRLSRHRVSMVDDYYADWDFAAAYHPHEHRTYTKLGHEDSEQEDSFTHELFHAISGRTIVRITTAWEPHTQELHDSRLGLSFNIMKPFLLHRDRAERDLPGLLEREPSEMVRKRFRWMNEAITEMLTARLRGGRPSHYDREIELLEVVANEGAHPIPMEYFIAAYFEDFEPEADRPIPAFKRLQAEINAAYGPGFLVALDDEVEATLEDSHDVTLLGAMRGLVERAKRRQADMARAA